MHKEWTDHMYNEGYWINRISWLNVGMWRLTRSNNRWVGGIGMVCAAALLAAMCISQVPVIKLMLSNTGKFLTLWEQMGIALGIIGWQKVVILLLFFAGNLVLFLLPPVHSTKKQPAERNFKQKAGKRSENR